MLLNRWFHPVLEPIDRTIEVLCGVIMVLTFTLTLSVSREGKADVHAMLVASIGCNLVWGIIDGIMHLLNSLAKRGRDRRVWHKLRTSKEETIAHRILLRELPKPIAEALQSSEVGALLERVRKQPQPHHRRGLTYDDWLGAFGVFLLVFLSTFPVVVPFIFIKDPVLALRLSTVIGLALLFTTGFLFGRRTNHRPWAMGLILVALGGLLTGLAIALGG